MLQELLRLLRRMSGEDCVRVSFSLSPHVVDLPRGIHRLAEVYGSGMMDAGELLHLAAALACFPWDRNEIVVEVGAFQGRTTVFMARTLEVLGKRASILSIDPFERAKSDESNPRGSYAAYLDNVRAAGLEDRCLPLVAFSRDAAAVVPHNIGLLVIDGSHHYAAVRDDFALYAPKVVPGGLIFVDDYTPGYPDVVRATDEFLAAERSFTRLHQTYFVVARRSRTEEPSATRATRRDRAPDTTHGSD